ncbi:hypothetical protein Glo7428_4515 [Gloeocapsa sp. PCC 7428]|nr:hypothetical protein Glo7428_4515 [Gloeocapsa sp. PCC 7428]
MCQVYQKVMRIQLLSLAGLIVLAPGIIIGCAAEQTPGEPQAQVQSPTQSPSPQQPTGTLQVRANGEERAREGLVSKDGWKITFDNVYATIANVTAYQSQPPFNPEQGGEIQAQEKVVVLDQATTVDLAQPGDGQDSVLVAEASNVPTGQYNALSWQMIPATEGPAQGQTIVMSGTAEKAGQTVNFVLNIDREFEYVCGEYVGDARKGIVQAGGNADLEATFHLDHLFGDGEASPDDSINQGALGFDPIAALAQNGNVQVNMAQLQSQAPQVYQQLQEILPSLGHVGEGHCREAKTQTTG